MTNHNRWQSRYKNRKTTPKVNETLKKYASFAPGRYALDIACGLGQNSWWLAEQGFRVDAVDFASNALKKIPPHPNIYKIESDIKDFDMGCERYDLIVCFNFFDPEIFERIKRALKKGGVVIYETYTYRKREINLSYTLAPNELIRNFLDFEICYYELVGDKAALVAKKENYGSSLARDIPCQKKST
jgi:2-polyprenyl-3-methyl-5-hydroxy-6-metoxy-1,4-benzoquinol methylase